MFNLLLVFRILRPNSRKNLIYINITMITAINCPDTYFSLISSALVDDP